MSIYMYTFLVMLLLNWLNFYFFVPICQFFLSSNLMIVNRPTMANADMHIVCKLSIAFTTFACPPTSAVGSYFR